MNTISPTADAEALTATILQKLGELGETLATAESCTGGAIAHAIARIPGASGAFRGSIVAYSPDVKRHLLGVPDLYLDDIGIVSRETALAMAAGVSHALDADWALSTTGYAGPAGGDARYPVGTVCLAIYARRHPQCAQTMTAHFVGNRAQCIHSATQYALQMLKNTLSLLNCNNQTQFS